MNHPNSILYGTLDKDAIDIVNDRSANDAVKRALSCQPLNVAHTHPQYVRKKVVCLYVCNIFLYWHAKTRDALIFVSLPTAVIGFAFCRSVMLGIECRLRDLISIWMQRARAFNGSINRFRTMMVGYTCGTKYIFIRVSCRRMCVWGAGEATIWKWFSMFIGWYFYLLCFLSKIQ